MKVEWTKSRGTRAGTLAARAGQLQDQQYRIKLEIKGKGDRTAIDGQFICQAFRLGKTNIRQGLEKLLN